MPTTSTARRRTPVSDGVKRQPPSRQPRAVVLTEKHERFQLEDLIASDLLQELVLKGKNDGVVIDDEFPLNSINLEGGRYVQVRDLIESLDTDTLEGYVQAMERGDTFPRIVLYQTAADALALIVAGLHRTEASERAGRTTVRAYILRKADLLKNGLSEQEIEESIKAFAYASNEKLGLRTDTNARVFRGLSLMDQGHSLKEASKMAGVSYQRLDKAREYKQFEIRLEAAGIPPKACTTILKDEGTRRILSKIPDNEVFSEAIKVTNDFRLDREAVKLLVEKVQSKKLPSEQKQVLVAKRQEVSPAIPKPVFRTSQLTVLEKIYVLLGKAVNADLPNNPEISETVDSIVRLALQMQDLFNRKYNRVA